MEQKCAGRRVLHGAQMCEVRSITWGAEKLLSWAECRAHSAEFYAGRACAGRGVHAVLRFFHAFLAFTLFKGRLLCNVNPNFFLLSGILYKPSCNQN